VKAPGSSTEEDPTIGDEKEANGEIFGSCPLPVFDHPQIVLGHGSGGKLSAELIDKVFRSRFSNPILERMSDSAVLEIGGARLAFTTDSFVVTPIFFPGGDIGSLAVNGTVNDLAMAGAHPLYLSAAFILEEGLTGEELERVADSLRAAATEAGVQIVAGDTKVVNRGKGDKVFITTTGIGEIAPDVVLGAERMGVGDKVIVSGYVGDHGITVLSQREGLEFEGDLRSDCAALNGLVDAMLDEARAARGAEAIRCMRDPTRGGVATTLNELAAQSGLTVLIEEDAIPVRDTVRGACEILGLDPLFVANEGKLLAVVAAEEAPSILRRMNAHPLGKDARIIGEIIDGPARRVLMKTSIGGTRIVDTLFGEQLPRIC
jgi:hydrogenase expression/formation protein HypE